MDLTFMKALESFRNGRSPIMGWYSASHTRKGCKFSGLSPWPFRTPFSPTKVSSGPDSLLSMSNTTDLTYMKALESFRNRRSPVWDRYSASRTRKGCTFSSLSPWHFSIPIWPKRILRLNISRTEIRRVNHRCKGLHMGRSIMFDMWGLESGPIVLYCSRKGPQK